MLGPKVAAFSIGLSRVVVQAHVLQAAPVPSGVRPPVCQQSVYSKALEVTSAKVSQNVRSTMIILLLFAVALE